MSTIALPSFLEPYREALEKSRKTYISIEATEIKEELRPWQSKFGGDPYLIDSTTYPKDKFDVPLLFLAQINFEEIPPLQGFPQKGLLQLFIQNAPDLITFGYDYESPKNSIFKVQYIEHIDYENGKMFQPAIVKHPSPYSKEKMTFSPFYPLESQYRLQFELKEELVNLTDYRIDYLMEEDDVFYRLLKELSHKHQIPPKILWDQYQQLHSGINHKMGGYPFFCQGDPRGNKYDALDGNPLPLRKYDTVLFQMISGNGINWGDAGVGHFLINEEALKKLDFTDIFYHWDGG